MVRGITTFKCDECSHTFKALDIEWCATVFSAPQQCPHCCSWHTAPRGMFGMINPMYKSIWKSIDERKA